MRKRFLNGKRVMALTLAFSMVVGEAGMVNAAPAEEQAVEAVEAVSENSTESEAVQAEDLDVAKVAALTVPGKVSNLRFEKEAQDGVTDNSRLSWDLIQEANGYEIRVVDANGVEYAYSTTYNSETKATELRYRNVSSPYDLDNLPYLDYDGYKFENNAYTYATDANKNHLHIKEGDTYTVYIRAYNSGYVDVTNADGSVGQTYKTVYGEWSDGITYTIPGYILEKVTEVKVVEQENEASYLSFRLGDNSNAQVEIKDAAGNEYFVGATMKDNAMVGTYITSTGNLDLDYTTAAYRYEIKEGNTDPTIVQKNNGDGTTSNVSAFMPGETYTLRVRGVGELNGEAVYSDWSDAVTYTCAENPVPEQPGQLEVDYEGYDYIYDEEEDTYYYVSADNVITWNSARYATGYEVEVKDAAGNWYTPLPSWDNKTRKYTIKNITTSNTRVALDKYMAYKLSEDGTNYEYVKENENYVTAGKGGVTYTVRVRAYNDKKDGKTKQYSEWSTLTYTLPATVAPAKVEGVRVTSNGAYIEWNEEKNAENSNTTYQVEVKDAAGREYFNDYTTKYDKTTKKTTYELNYYSTLWTDTSSADSLKTYQMVDEKPKAVIHPETGYTVYAFEQGQTYTVRVRAVRTLEGAKEPTYGEWSDAVTYTVPVSTISTGINAKPAKVTGVWIQTENKKDEDNLSGATMRWNVVENANRYEFEIKDSKGNLYTEYPDYYNGQYVTDYPSWTSSSKMPSIPMSNLRGKKSYSKPEGSAYVTLKNAEGKDAVTFEPGETYTIRVRAINRYVEYDQTTQQWKTAVEYQGDWSDAVTYAPAKKASVVTGLKLERTDDYNYYFSYKADVLDSIIYYQIATDANFNSTSLVQDWTPAETGGKKLAISKGATYLKPATTYYVRVVNSIYGMPNTSTMEKSIYDEILATAATTSFTTEAKKAPKNITGLKVYSEDEKGYSLRFNAVLKDEDGDNYEIQIASDPNSANWNAIATNSKYIYSSSLNDGPNYLRAVAYVWQYNEATQKTEKVYGTPSNVITINKNESVTSAIGKLKMAEEADYNYTFSYTGNLRKDEDVEVWYSDSKKFETNNNTVDTIISSYSASVNKKFTISKLNLKPGKTYYVKVRTKNEKAKTTAGKYSAFSNVIKVKTSVPKINVSSSSVTKTSITLNMSNMYDSWWVKGYEIQRKSVSGKKTTWETINKSSDSTYTDKKLKADTTYSYRVRPYYFDEETNKTTNGSWAYFEAMTGWTGALNLKVAAASKNSIKLSWNTIKGAKGYEVYRVVTNSTATQVSNGQGNAFKEYKLIANLSSSKKAYTDKKLTAGMSYSYVVKAYKTVGGKKVYIEESGNASLDFALSLIRTVQKSNGKLTVTWNPVYSAKGYLIEKLDNASDKWKTYKKITKVKTSSYTFPKATDKEYGDTYRIRAYNGSKYTNAQTVYVAPIIAAPTSVKAKATKNGIKVSWKAVKGADYYRVFRTTSAKTVYNKDTKTYNYQNSVEVGRYVADKSQISGYRLRDLEEMNVTSVMDQAIVYSYNGIDNRTLYTGPDTGVKYYYYVVAYKNTPQHEYVYDNDEACDDGDYYASGNSKAASATIKEAKPAKSKITKATSKSKSVTLTVKASKNADGYEIERSTSKKKGYTVIGEVTDLKKLTYKDKYNKKTNALKKGKTYYYRVRAFQYNEDGSKVYAGYSAVKSVKVK